MNPRVIENNPDSAKTGFCDLVKVFAEKSQLENVNLADVSVQQYEKLIDSSAFQSKVRDYNNCPEKEKTRLDDFYWELVGSHDCYAEVWSIIRKVLTLSHGNATVSAI